VVKQLLKDLKIYEFFYSGRVKCLQQNLLLPQIEIWHIKINKNCWTGLIDKVKIFKDFQILMINQVHSV
jgi:hypothetical protein